jgi:2'-5' RNA ligase
VAESAFVVRVPEAEPSVGALRARFDASAKLGVPAHITLLFPFMSPERITGAVLERAERALHEVAAFPFQLVAARRFAATAYLAPEPAAPFVALTQKLVERFPEYPPYGGKFQSVVPHLTAAHGSAEAAECAAAELKASLSASGSIKCTCSAVALLENSSGLWKEMHVFSLPGADG